MAMKSRLKFGTSSDDTLNGTEQSEIFLGFGGNDTIFARGGNDHAFGGRGNDLIFGGNGNDHLFGGRGNDALVGEAGKDHLFGGSGRDLLLGGPGKDLLVGGADNDTFLIRHGTGVDTIADLQAGDRIDIRDFNFASFQAVLNAGHQAHDDVVINLGGGDQLVIEDAKLSDLHAEQFIISSQIQGPTSSQTPYLVSANSHVTVESLITTGDQALNGYTMVGIPDGLGAFDNGNGTFTVLMNHEISNSNPALAGAVRTHGANGAFVSEWVIDKTTLQVVSGKDLMHDVWLFDTATQTYVDHNAALGNGVSFSRFCSADLADPNAFYNPATGLGFNPADGRLFLDGEENNAEGRAMAHIVGGAQDGNSYELAWLGNMAYENQLANPFTGDKTVVGMLNDTAAAGNNAPGTSAFSGNDRGEVYFYVGDKQSTGLAIDKAGLTGGGMYGVKVAGMEFETDLTTKAVNGAHFDLVAVGDPTNTSADVHNLTGSAPPGTNNIESNSQAGHVTGFERPEDGAWDTIDHNRFYFVTTASTANYTAPGTNIGGHSKLWELDFVDAKNPTLGGTVKMLLDGTEGQSMFDNITVSPDGKITLCEDPGNNDRVAKVWQYDPANGSLTEIAHHDPARFDPNLNGPGVAGPNFITKDEESSGVIDVSKILGNAGEHAFLIDTQSHKEVGGALVEGGQLMVMHQYLV
jgi:RTX calcium-binding nonapeptide repeat (4 copies)